MVWKRKPEWLGVSKKKEDLRLREKPRTRKKDRRVRGMSIYWRSRGKSYGHVEADRDLTG